MKAPERILCAAVYVDTGKAEPPRRSYAYPATGLVFAAWRHGDCFTTLYAWADLLPEEERAWVEAHIHQGFLTSRGRYVNRREAYRIALAIGQVEPKAGAEPELFSEDLY